MKFKEIKIINKFFNSTRSHCAQVKKFDVPLFDPAPHFYTIFNKFRANRLNVSIYLHAKYDWLQIFQRGKYILKKIPINQRH